MNKIAVVATSMLLAGAVSVGAAGAADLSSPMPVKAAPAPEPAPLWDVAFGVKLATDYVFRGISQTDGNPAVQGYAELRLFDWIYGGVWASNVDFPAINQWGTGFTGLTDPSAEIDLYGGLRHTWGGFTADVGFVYYYYPGEIGVNTLGAGIPSVNIDYWEIYFKPTYVINDVFTVGGNLYYTDSYAGSGSDGTYLSGTVKIDFTKWSTIPGLGFYISGELGYQWLGQTDLGNIFVANYELPSYTTWNVGVAFTYKAATLDLRYYGSTLSEGPAFVNGVGYAPFGTCGVISGLQNVCGDRYVASLSFDTSFLALK